MTRLFPGLSMLLLSMSGAHADGWDLVWSDEFNDAGLPDPAKWNYEVGYIRNDEAQFYTRARLENTRVENDALRRPHYLLLDFALGGF